MEKRMRDWTVTWGDMCACIQAETREKAAYEAAKALYNAGWVKRPGEAFRKMRVRSAESPVRDTEVPTELKTLPKFHEDFLGANGLTLEVRMADVKRILELCSFNVGNAIKSDDLITAWKCGWNAAVDMVRKYLKQ